MLKKLSCFFSISNYCFDLGLPSNLKSFLQYAGLIGLPLVFMMLSKMFFPAVWSMMTRRSKDIQTPVQIYYRPKKVQITPPSSDMMHFIKEIIDRYYVFLLCIVIGTIILSTIVTFKKIKSQRCIYRHQVRVNKVAAQTLSIHRKYNTLHSTRKKPHSQNNILSSFDSLNL